MAEECTALQHGVRADSPQRTYAVISLAKRCLTQCDVQVSKLNRYAFCLAEVAVRVAVFEPKFGTILIALLHESCVLSVPKYYPFVPSRYTSDEEYFKLMAGPSPYTTPPLFSCPA